MTIRKAQGFALIDLIFVCGIIGLISPHRGAALVLAKQAAGAASAIGSLRTIASAQLTFALTCGNGFYAPNLTALGTPPPGSNEPFIARTSARPTVIQKSSYTFRLEGAPFAGAPPTCNGCRRRGGQGYRAAADPLGTRQPALLRHQRQLAALSSTT